MKLSSADGTVCASQPISWAAIFAGALAAAAISLILLLLGTGLGFSSVSPWADSGMGAAAVGAGVIFWLVLTQLIASGLGGYISGRLRGNWQGTSEDEGFFRDSVHGFLTWGLATLVTATLLSGAVGKIIGATAEAGGAVAAGAATAAVTAAAGGAAAASSDSASESVDYLGYYIDSLFRKVTDEKVTVTSKKPPSPEELAEITRIFANAISDGQLAKNDARYIGEKIADRIDVSSEEATKHVQKAFDDLKAKLKQLEKEAKEAADKARAAAAHAALWTFISLLIGAFVAAFAATRGGASRNSLS